MRPHFQDGGGPCAIYPAPGGRDSRPGWSEEYLFHASIKCWYVDESGPMKEQERVRGGKNVAYDRQYGKLDIFKAVPLSPSRHKVPERLQNIVFIKAQCLQIMRCQG